MLIVGGVVVVFVIRVTFNVLLIWYTFEMRDISSNSMSVAVAYCNFGVVFLNYH